MKLLRFLPVALFLAVVLVAAGCGGGSKGVPSTAVARVGNDTITKAQFNDLLAGAQRTYTARKTAFPKAGTTAVQVAPGSGDAVPRPAVGARAEGEGAGRHGDRQGRRRRGWRRSRSSTSAAGGELPEAAEGAGPHRAAAQARPARADPLGEALQRGHRQAQGARTPRSRSTTTRTRRSTAPRRAATCATSS